MSRFTMRKVKIHYCTSRCDSLLSLQKRNNESKFISTRLYGVTYHNRETFTAVKTARFMCLYQFDGHQRLINTWQMNIVALCDAANNNETDGNLL
jgi:hypothetical protein